MAVVVRPLGRGFNLPDMGWKSSSKWNELFHRLIYRLWFQSQFEEWNCENISRCQIAFFGEVFRLEFFCFFNRNYVFEPNYPSISNATPQKWCNLKMGFIWKTKSIRSICDWGFYQVQSTDFVQKNILNQSILFFKMFVSFPFLGQVLEIHRTWD